MGESDQQRIKRDENVVDHFTHNWNSSEETDEKGFQENLIH